eukprot:6185406-Pleurochrysis_carterae.AAC.1
MSAEKTATSVGLCARSEDARTERLVKSGASGISSSTRVSRPMSCLCELNACDARRARRLRWLDGEAESGVGGGA